MWNLEDINLQLTVVAGWLIQRYLPLDPGGYSTGYWLVGLDLYPEKQNIELT
jgi:hypothetical protein